MIVTRKKPEEEILAMLEGTERVALVGCGSCAEACRTGGEEEVREMERFLSTRGVKVTGTVVSQECCHRPLVRRETKHLRNCGAEAILVLACGDGVQTVADSFDLPVYPANNTLFLGQIHHAGEFGEYCRMCGDCVLGDTGGICPVARCAKSMVNGPCGGQRDGKCEVEGDKDCAWVLIYRRLARLGQTDKLLKSRRERKNPVHPGYVNVRGQKP